MNYADVRDMLVHNVIPRRPGLSERDIISKALDLQNNEDQLFLDSDFDEADFVRTVKEVLRTESGKPDGLISRSKKGRPYTYSVRRLSPPQPVGSKPPTDTNDQNYIGKMGEFAVLSELVAAGYNANMMAIDEGIDIVASKNNIFYYIQVKTTYLDEKKRFSVQIPVQNFDRVYNGNVVYVAAVREGIGKFKIFIFPQKDIERLINDKYVDKTDSNIIIRIQYDSVTGIPMFYNGRETTKALSYLAGNNGRDLL